MKLVCLKVSLEVSESMPEGVSIDSAGGKWRSVHACHQQWETIGHGCYINQFRPGDVIGVYDLDDVKQAGQMVRDAVKSRRDSANAD